MKRVAFLAAGVVFFGAASAMADELTCEISSVDTSSGNFTCGDEEYLRDENVIGMTVEEMKVGESVKITYQTDGGNTRDIVSIEKAE